jgi:enoyl-CoA hydratase/carnithine racemase
MTGPALELAVQGALARVTLRHPGKFNAMSRAMWRELQRVFEAIHADPTVRCVLLQGADDHFCAGGDISEYPSFRFDPVSLQEFHENEVWGGLRAMLDCDVPMVALIQGHCMGAGLEMACCCDIRIAAASARFGAPIAHLGFPMAPREAQLVARELGLLTAREMLLCAAVLDASSLQARGFLTQVHADQDVAHKALAVAHRITTLAPQAARMNKQTLRSLLAPVDAPVATEVPAPGGHPAYRYAAGAEHREGVSAFMDKRPPFFTNDSMP